ncbi:hypothetical protein LT85_3115 [Collimonas arenae]|uniref:Uncharacterized protein n=1 Tax=Collimonas arenae TaxID=279058 RepID=A0A0A1FC24_9BURK|nr:hypothetical protein [Collimonas arenae]AIY42273.1 hypothetical protein LT85_3115 [Collimonas arenae]
MPPSALGIAADDPAALRDDYKKEQEALTVYLPPACCYGSVGIL